VLQTDINLFYPSVYAHTMPWAIHGKATAKVNRANKLLGNLLDSLVRCGQDQQTIGIPIGPDTSLLLAEILLNRTTRYWYTRFPETPIWLSFAGTHCTIFVWTDLAAVDAQLLTRLWPIKLLPGHHASRDRELLVEMACTRPGE
jgi:hypothetical protein